MSTRDRPRAFPRIAWPVALATAIPASLIAARTLIIPPVTVDKVATTERVARAERLPRAGSPTTGGWAALVLRTVLFGAILVVVDECAGLDILYRAFNIDILPKTKTQKLLREHRATWRAAKASGSPARIREAFFQLKRERFELAGTRFQEEAMKSPWDTRRPSELASPEDVRVFFILSGRGHKSSTTTTTIAKIYIAFNMDPGEPGARERIDRTTQWVLTRQVEAKLAGGRLEMPCKLERAYRDRSESQHELHLSRDGNGSQTLADAWNRRRTVYRMV